MKNGKFEASDFVPELCESSCLDKLPGVVKLHGPDCKAQEATDRANELLEAHLKTLPLLGVYFSDKTTTLGGEI